MKHIKTFESYVGSINEAAGLAPKIKKVWQKYASETDMTLTMGADLKGFYDDEELDGSQMDAIDAMGGKPETLLDFTTFDGGEEDFSDFVADLKSAGIKHKTYMVDHGGPGVIVENK
jgi:hypothetical protein